jgi:hypothetical protein
LPLLKRVEAKTVGVPTFRDDEDKKNADNGTSGFVDPIQDLGPDRSKKPDAGHHAAPPTHLESHLQPTMDGRQPDEVEIDWRRYVTPMAPSHPFPVRDVAVYNAPDGVG